MTINVTFFLRLLVAAWETGGLVNADDNCCELIVLAVQVRTFLYCALQLLFDASCLVAPQEHHHSRAFKEKKLSHYLWWYLLL